MLSNSAMGTQLQQLRSEMGSKETVLFQQLEAKSEELAANNWVAKESAVAEGDEAAPWRKQPRT